MQVHLTVNHGRLMFLGFFFEKQVVRREKLDHISSHFPRSFQYLGDRNGSWG